MERKDTGRDVLRLTGEPLCVYFSSVSNNTHRFVLKLGFESLRIPVELDESLIVSRDYILICPTYSGGGEHTSGAVPKQVIRFLNKIENRSYCRGIIAGGNTNFGNTYGLAGTVLAKKLNVPLLYTFEISGTTEDVSRIQLIIRKIWGKDDLLD